MVISYSNSERSKYQMVIGDFNAKTGKYQMVSQSLSLKLADTIWYFEKNKKASLPNGIDIFPVRYFYKLIINLQSSLLTS